MPMSRLKLVIVGHLHVACSKGRAGVAGMLVIELNVNIEVKDYFRKTPSQTACDNGHDAVLSMLVAESDAVVTSQVSVGNVSLLFV